MHRRLMAIILILTPFHTKLYGQDTNQKSSPRPVTFQAAYTGDLVSNLTGGIRQGTVYLGMASLMLEVNSDKSGLYKGGTLFVNLVNTHGATPSAELIGDFHVASNIEAGNHTYFQELWYSQAIGNASIIIGLQDLCREFISSSNASIFLNSSFGVPSTISSNSPVPIFPVTAIGAQMHYRFTETFTTRIAVFDGLPDDFDSNPYNLGWKISKSDGVQVFAEMSLNNEEAILPGSYKMGYHFHNGMDVHEDQENGISVRQENIRHGFYAVIDQAFYNNQQGRIFGVFIQAGMNPGCENLYYLGAGLNCSGISLKRCHDQLGLALAHAGFDGHDFHETVLECTYHCRLNEKFYIQPDLQYIMNPSGAESGLSDAIAGILRFGFEF